MALDKRVVRALSAECDSTNPSFEVCLKAIDMATNTKLDELGDYERSISPILQLAKNHTSSPEILNAIAKVAVHSSVLIPLVQNPSTPVETIEYFFSRDDFVFYPRSSALSEIRICAAVNLNANTRIIELSWKEFLANSISRVHNEISDHTVIPTNFLGNYISYILGNPNTPQFIRDEAIEKYLPNVYEHQSHHVIIGEDIIAYLRAQTSKTLPSRFVSHPDIPVDMLEDFLADESMDYKHRYILSNPSLPMETFVSHLENKSMVEFHNAVVGYSLPKDKLAALWDIYKKKTLVYAGVMSKEDAYVWNNYLRNINSQSEVVDEITRLAIAKKELDTLANVLTMGKASQSSYKAALDCPDLEPLDVYRVLKNKYIDVATLLPYIEQNKHGMKSYATKNSQFLNRVKDYLIAEESLTEDARSLPNDWLISILGW
jgi:hypothetical protein